MTQYEVYNTATGNVISHPCDHATAHAIADTFNAAPINDNTYAIRAIVPHTIYKARVNPTNPGQPDLLEVVVTDLSQAVAHQRAFEMTAAMGECDWFYTARLNALCGPVRRYTQMPWGELIPDFS